MSEKCPKCRTYGGLFEEAMKLKTTKDATEWLKKQVEHLLQYHNDKNKTPEELAEITKSNLGYFAGYYGHKEAQKIYKLFGAVHPVFGTADYHKTVTPKKAFAMGVEAGKKLLRGKR